MKKSNIAQIQSLIFIVAVLVVIAFMAVIALLMTGQTDTTTSSKYDNNKAGKSNKAVTNTEIDLPQIKVEPVDFKSIEQLKEKIASKIYEFKSKENIDNKVRQLMNQQISANASQYIRFYISDNFYKYYFNKKNPDNILGDSVIVVVSKLGQYSGDEKYIFKNTNGNFEIVKKLDIDGDTDKVEIADDYVVINTYNYDKQLSEGKSYVIMSIDDDYKVVWSGATYSRKSEQRNPLGQPREKYTYGDIKIYNQFDTKTQKDQLLLKHFTFSDSDRNALTKTYIMDKSKCTFMIY